MNSGNSPRPAVKQWSLLTLALLIGILIGTFAIPQLSNSKSKEFAVYTKHLDSTRVGPFELSIHTEGKYVAADVTYTAVNPAQLDTLYIDAGQDFNKTQDGRTSSIQYQTLQQYGTFEGALPTKFLKGETEHIRLYPILSGYNSGQVTGYMIKLEYK